MRLLSPALELLCSDPKNIELHREVINTVVVVQKRMPFGNETKMTQEERDRIASWARAGS